MEEEWWRGREGAWCGRKGVTHTHMRTLYARARVYEVIHMGHWPTRVPQAPCPVSRYPPASSALDPPPTTILKFLCLRCGAFRFDYGGSLMGAIQ